LARDLTIVRAHEGESDRGDDRADDQAKQAEHLHAAEEGDEGKQCWNVPVAAHELRSNDVVGQNADHERAP